MDPEENIKNLLPPRQVIFQKEKRHVSKHHGAVCEEQRTYKGAHATMGYARTPVERPSHYMKTHHRDSIERIVTESNKAKAAGNELITTPRSLIRSWRSSQKNYLSRDTMYTVTQIFLTVLFASFRGRINWVESNVEHVKALSPSRPSPRFVDVPGGDTQDLLPSGLFPRYVFKKNFGQVPTYLQRRQQQLQIEREIEDQEEALRSSRSIKADRDKDDTSLLTEQDRMSMLKGLRTNLREAQRQLQTLPVVCETNANKKKRDTLEQTVSDLGRYIFLLENYKVAIRN
ncbi:enkurin-like [Macrobrachium nipponense]|uniref:enkurin-like n=1 Tax=Macrobrachium nipponense TaxID=159736 RepID=UPI0030C81592